MYMYNTEACYTDHSIGGKSRPCSRVQLTGFLSAPDLLYCSFTKYPCYWYCLYMKKSIPIPSLHFNNILFSCAADKTLPASAFHAVILPLALVSRGRSIFVFRITSCSSHSLGFVDIRGTHVAIPSQ